MNDSVPAEALALHQGLLTIDTHIDIPWPTGPDPFVDGTRRVDLPKMQRGGVAAGCFAAYVPQAARTPQGEAAAFERTIGMLNAIRHMGRSENGIAARVASTVAEIEAAKRDGVLAIVPAVENGFAMGNDLSRLAEFRRLGACYMTLTHNGHNAIGELVQPSRRPRRRPDRAWWPEPAGARRGRGAQPRWHADRRRACVARHDAAGRRTVAHTCAVDTFLRPRSVQQRTQYG